MYRQVSLLLIYDKKKFLLQLRDAKVSILYPNHWGGFAGTIEQNENPKEAAYRELFEELEVIPNKLDFFQTFSVPSDYASIHVFSCKLENELQNKIKLKEKPTLPMDSHH